MTATSRHRKLLITALVLAGIANRTVAFAGRLAIGEIVAITLFNYAYKFVIAVGITPLIYAAHWVMDRYLGDELAEALVEQAEGDAVA